MPHGTVTRIERQFGFGFLVDDAGMDWLFVREGVRGGRLERLAPRERVTFTYEWTSSGPRAADVAPEFPQRTD
jgi:cold shock CspA family protein